MTELQIKDDISSFNDKRYMTDNLTSKPHIIKFKQNSRYVKNNNDQIR